MLQDGTLGASLSMCGGSQGTCRYVHHYIFPNGITSNADEDLSPVLDVVVEPR